MRFRCMDLSIFFMIFPILCQLFDSQCLVESTRNSHSFSSSSRSAHVKHSSLLCPFRYVVNHRENRVPATLFEVKCVHRSPRLLGRYLKFGSTKLRCKPRHWTLTVLECPKATQSASSEDATLSSSELTISSDNDCQLRKERLAMTCVPVVISGDDSGTTTDEYQIKTMALTRRKSSGVGRGKRRQQQNNPAEGNDEEKKIADANELDSHRRRYFMVNNHEEEDAFNESDETRIAAEPPNKSQREKGVNFDETDGIS